MLAVRIGALDACDALIVVAAEKELLHHLGDALDAKKARMAQAPLHRGPAHQDARASECSFIEYIPGEQAWRAVHADGYLLIHCLWVVGKSKGPRLCYCLAERVRH
jgi:hypothetical protein